MRSAFLALAVAITRAPRAAASWTSRPPVTPPAPDPDKLVPVANASGGDVDQDLVCARRRQLVHLKDLDGLAECSDPGRSHPGRRTLLASVMRCGPPWHLVKELRLFDLSERP